MYLRNRGFGRNEIVLVLCFDWERFLNNVLSFCRCLVLEEEIGDWMGNYVNKMLDIL